MALLSGCRYCLAVLVLCLGASATRAEPQGHVPADVALSRYDKTVMYLQTSDTQSRVGFARIALELLTLAYLEEAEIAREDEEGSPGERNLGAWAAAVERYARQFGLMLDDLDLGLPILLAREAGDAISLNVAGRKVILSHPRPSQQAVFEQRVLQEFCGLHACEEFARDHAATTPIPMSAGSVRPRWVFTGDGPSCTLDGLSIRFATTVDLSRARPFCVDFFA
ncbi:MAG: hypothetical protein R3308_10150, partial [Thiohalobacterales bacterium]|nr:hypothetical protein [Thiohalobacterales bacterium]